MHVNPRIHHAVWVLGVPLPHYLTKEKMPDAYRAGQMLRSVVQIHADLCLLTMGP
jgi:hypothetical protein